MNLMGSFPARIDDAHATFLGILMLGILMNVFAILGCTLGSMPDGDRWNPDMVSRDSEPIKFWAMVIVMVAGGVMLMVCGVVGLVIV
jgi:hypothetical protein